MTERRRRFIAFVSRQDEIHAYREQWPGNDFEFASFTSGIPDSVAVRSDRVDEMLQTFLELHKKQPFCGVLNRKEKCVIPAALLATALGLPEHIRDPQLARDKYRMRLAMNTATDGPRCLLLQTRTDAEGVPLDFFPAVLKPRFGFNSRGVCRVNNHTELLEHYDTQHASYAALQKQDGTCADFVVEQLIPGSEHTIDSFVIDGSPVLHLVSDKLPMQSPWFVETGDNLPSSLDSDMQEQVRDCTSRTIRSLQIGNGWTHTEVRVSNRGVVPIECAARMGGGYFENLIRTAWNIDRMDWLIRLFSEITLPAFTQPPRPVCGRRFVVYGPRHFWRLENAEQLFSSPDVQLIWPPDPRQINRNLAGPPENFSNTLFEFMTVGSSVTSVIAAAEKVLETALVFGEPA